MLPIKTVVTSLFENLKINKNDNIRSDMKLQDELFFLLHNMKVNMKIKLKNFLLIIFPYIRMKLSREFISQNDTHYHGISENIRQF